MKILAFLILAVLSHSTFSQVGPKVSGKIIDDKLNCLIGAQITNLNNGAKAISDRNGNFGILAEASDTLSFQFIGLTTERIVIKDPTLSLNLIMINKDVNCLGANWTERQYKRAYRKVEKQLKKTYKEADKQNAWKNSNC